MDVIITDKLLNTIMISITFSIILMAFIQKLKDLKIVKKDWQIWVVDFIFSFLIGIPFSITFFDLEIYLAIWVSIFGFIGAPTIYKALKAQNIINYKPQSLEEVKEISIENEIKRN